MRLPYLSPEFISTSWSVIGAIYRKVLNRENPADCVLGITGCKGLIINPRKIWQSALKGTRFQLSLFSDKRSLIPHKTIRKNITLRSKFNLSFWLSFVFLFSYSIVLQDLVKLILLTLTQKSLKCNKSLWLRLSIRVPKGPIIKPLKMC